MGDYLAVVLDNKVQEVAVIKEAIRDTGIINGRFTEQQTQDLAMTLRSGALPAGIKYLEERTVGPSLGADSIQSRRAGGDLGMLAVLIFMLIYYRWAGVNADVALIFNLVILLGFMGYLRGGADAAGDCGRDPDGRHGRGFQRADFRAHPRRAGNGKTPPSAVEQGFSPCLDHDRGYARHDDRLGRDFVYLRNRAGKRVCDDAGVWFAREPVYGGVCIAGDFRLGFEPEATRRGIEYLEGAVRRSLFAVRENRCSAKASDEKPIAIFEGIVSSVEFFRNTNIDFLGKKWYFLIFSLIFSVAGVLSMAFWHGIPLGVDFRGGTLVYVKYSHTPDPSAIHTEIERAGLKNARVQALRGGHKQRSVDRSRHSGDQRTGSGQGQGSDHAGAGEQCRSRASRI